MLDNSKYLNRVEYYSHNAELSRQKLIRDVSLFKYTLYKKTPKLIAVSGLLTGFALNNNNQQKSQRNSRYHKHSIKSKAASILFFYSKVMTLSNILKRVIRN